MLNGFVNLDFQSVTKKILRLNVDSESQDIQGFVIFEFASRLNERESRMNYHQVPFEYIY